MEMLPQSDLDSGMHLPGPPASLAVCLTPLEVSPLMLESCGIASLLGTCPQSLC